MRAAPLRKPIRRALASDRRARSMTWMDHRRRRPARRCARATPPCAPDRQRQIGAPNRSGKEQITAEDDVVRIEHDVPRRVSGQVQSPRTTTSRRSARRRRKAAASGGSGCSNGTPYIAACCAPREIQRKVRRMHVHGNRPLAQHAGDRRRCDRDARGSARSRRASPPTRRTMSSKSSGSAPGSISAARLRRLVDHEIRILLNGADRPRIDDHAV